MYCVHTCPIIVLDARPRASARLLLGVIVVFWKRKRERAAEYLHTVQNSLADGESSCTESPPAQRVNAVSPGLLRRGCAKHGAAEEVQWRYAAATALIDNYAFSSFFFCLVSSAHSVVTPAALYCYYGVHYLTTYVLCCHVVTTRISRRSPCEFPSITVRSTA